MKTTAGKKNFTPSLSSRPFLSKKAEGGFFAQTREAEQRSFTPDISRQGGAVGGHNFANIPIFPPRAQPVIQPKLTINEPGDKYEQEADAMSDRVMRMSAPVGEGGDDGIVQTKPLNITAIQRKCSACEEEEEPLQTKPLMRKSAESGGYTASPQLASQLNSSKGGGDPLPRQTLGSMNQAFGADFSSVRIHTGSQAAEMSQGIRAKAFTHGSDVYFNRGQYSPESSEGKRLLGHELTHVVQQRITGQRSSISPLISIKQHSMEDEIDAGLPHTSTLLLLQSGTAIAAAGGAHEQEQQVQLGNSYRPHVVQQSSNIELIQLEPNPVKSTESKPEIEFARLCDSIRDNIYRTVAEISEIWYMVKNGKSDHRIPPMSSKEDEESVLYWALEWTSKYQQEFLTLQPYLGYCGSLAGYKEVFELVPIMEQYAIPMPDTYFSDLKTAQSSFSPITNLWKGDPDFNINFIHIIEEFRQIKQSLETQESVQWHLGRGKRHPLDPHHRRPMS